MVVNKQDDPEFGQRELVRKVSPNIQRMKQDEEEPMVVVGSIYYESIDEQLAKVNMLDEELMVVEESMEVPKIRKV